jgi:hypothetical protein
MNNKFMPGKIKYVKGSALNPYTSDNRLILLFSDTNGDFDSDEFAKNINKRWAKVSAEYKNWNRSQNKFTLGKHLIVQVQSDTNVTCMLVKEQGELNTKSLITCLKDLAQISKLNKYNIHIEKTEDWDVIEPIVTEQLVNAGLLIFIYE